MTALRLCNFDDVPDGGSAGFVAEFPDRKLGVMVLRRGADVFVYENMCPHIGMPLDFKPGQFLDVERKHIICSTHGALFHIEDGRCFSGPCRGDRLTRINAEVRDGGLYVHPPVP